MREVFRFLLVEIDPEIIEVRSSFISTKITGTFWLIETYLIPVVHKNQETNIFF